jgi:TatD DNase family protein
LFVCSVEEQNINHNLDAPWCDVRPTHAGFKLLSGYSPHTFEKKKKERFELGSMIKGRNEPCEVGYV